MVGGRAPDPLRRRLPGRRRGRRLRQNLQKLIDELLPRISLDLAGTHDPLDLSKIFGAETTQYWLEVGFGSGEHLAWQANQHPQVGILGAEIYVNGIAGLLRDVDQGDLGNVRVYQGDGRDLLARLPEASIDRAFALFADPWPKERHHKRRLIQWETLDGFARVLQDGAELRLATDHGDYLVWILERVCRHPDFEWLARRPADWRSRPEGWPPTRYEQKAIAQGRQPTFLRFRRRSRDGSRGGWQSGNPGPKPRRANPGNLEKALAAPGPRA